MHSKYIEDTVANMFEKCLLIPCYTLLLIRLFTMNFEPHGFLCPTHICSLQSWPVAPGYMATLARGSANQRNGRRHLQGPSVQSAANARVVWAAHRVLLDIRP